MADLQRADYNTGGYNSGATPVASGVVVAVRARLLGFHGYNYGPQQFIMFFNSATVPADGAVPDVMWPITAAQGFAFNIADICTDRRVGRFWIKGISWSNSTNAAAPTKLIGAANIWLSVDYQQ